MNFDLSEEQVLLQASIQRFVQDRYDLEKRRKYLVGPHGYDPGNYETLAELGLLMLPFAEADGGLGGGPVDTMVVMEALGPALLAEPYFATAVFSAALLNQLGAARPFAEAIGSGEATCAVAHAERAGRFSLSFVETAAAKSGDHYQLTGRKTLVPHGNAQSNLLVLARTAGDVSDESGLSILHVPAGSENLRFKSYRTVDGNVAAEIEFLGAGAQLLGQEGAAFSAFEMAVAEATFAVCAEAVGILQAMFDETLDYVKTRKQFGVPIGSFQAIQHRMSDCYMALEQCRAMVLKAALANRQERQSFLQIVAGAKALISEKAEHIGHECIQFHGGMGVTDELIISHYHKRLQMIAMLFGDAKAHLARYEAARAA